MTTNKAVVYFHTGNKFDTPLDALHVQAARVEEWAQTMGYEIIKAFHDNTADRPSLVEACSLSKKKGARLLSSAISRIADEPLDYLKMKREYALSFCDAEGWELLLKDGTALAHLDFTLLTQIAAREQYLSHCSKYLY